MAVPTEAGLDRYIEDWSPAPITMQDVISGQRAQQAAAVLDADYVVSEGGPLPPLWHWAYFIDLVPTNSLGDDGHPRESDFLPPIPQRRRMFAGGRCSVYSPLVVGESAQRHTTMVGRNVKQGSTGELLFVTVRHEYVQRSELRMTEEQDLVYRSDQGNSTAFSLATKSLAPQRTAWASVPKLTPALLFRFSALTGNAHRIHYDHTYTTTVEGFPALVVQGPLLAILMTELARAHRGPIKAVEFRLKRPVFVPDEIRVEGAPADDQKPVALSVVSGNGTVHASASATFE